MAKSEYLTMKICLTESKWQDATDNFRYCKADDRLEQLKKIDLLAWEIERLKKKGNVA